MKNNIYIQSEGTNIRKAVEKEKLSTAPLAEREKNAVDYFTKNFKSEAERSGRSITGEEARKKAVAIAEYYNQRKR